MLFITLKKIEIILEQFKSKNKQIMPPYMDRGYVRDYIWENNKGTVFFDNLIREKITDDTILEKFIREQNVTLYDVAVDGGRINTIIPVRYYYAQLLGNTDLVKAYKMTKDDTGTYQFPNITSAKLFAKYCYPIFVFGDIMEIGRGIEHYVFRNIGDKIITISENTSYYSIASYVKNELETNLLDFDPSDKVLILNNIDKPAHEQQKCFLGYLYAAYIYYKSTDLVDDYNIIGWLHEKNEIVNKKYGKIRYPHPLGVTNGFE